MFDFLVVVHGPDIFLVEIEDGYFASLGDVDEDGVQLGGVGVFALSFLLVIDVDLFFGEIDVSWM